MKRWVVLNAGKKERPKDAENEQCKKKNIYKNARFRILQVIFTFHDGLAAHCARHIDNKQKPNWESVKQACANDGYKSIPQKCKKKNMGN